MNTAQNTMMPTQNTATVIFDEQEGRQAFTMANLVFNPSAMQAVNQLANMLADNSGMVPEHFRGKPGDLMGVIMQAGRWGMDPIAVAQSTFVLSGKIGYEAKLMQAVARANGGIDFEPEYYGDWSKIQGNIKKEKKQRKGSGGSTYMADVDAQGWTAVDEKQVGIKLVGTFPDGKVKTIDVPLCTCFPRNSTNWIYDPQQQIYYTAVKRWVRRFAPHLGLGIQDYDDLAARQSEPTEREINPIPEKVKAQVKKPVEPQDIDDILNGDDAPMQSAQFEQEVSDVDDILNGDMMGDNQGGASDFVDSDGVYIPTPYEQMIDLLNDVNTVEDYEQAKTACSETVTAGKVSEDEAENLRKTLRTLRDALGIPPTGAKK